MILGEKTPEGRSRVRRRRPRGRLILKGVDSSADLRRVSQCGRGVAAGRARKTEPDSLRDLRGYRELEGKGKGKINNIEKNLRE